MTIQYWLVKTEPEAYSWATFVKDKRTDWTGVRNYQARNHLKAMKKGDRVLFYGDSITEQRYWAVAVETYVRTRCPELPVKFVNSAVGGATVTTRRPDGTVRWGVGRHESITTASFRAVVSAADRPRPDRRVARA